MTGRVTRVTLLTQADCAYCDHAKQVLGRVENDFPLDVTEVGLDSAEGRELAARHRVLFAPGIVLDDDGFGYGRLSERRLRKELSRRSTADQLAASRSEELDRDSPPEPSIPPASEGDVPERGTGLANL